ncbi:uncharacterized protein LOC132631154 [Lycium barbarum]|uniref:uncharacterized protein LOC132631154 n=1 Tax=Lycium barbarum TaxID=112863 RepID=UPI00293F38D8|nr:uncharacterized protein LOC132631154 [Lycium barbarum]
MATPADPLPARVTQNHNPTGIPNMENESTLHKINYAEAIQTVPDPSPKKNRDRDPNVKARYDRHDGKTAVLFKPTEFYGVMANEYFTVESDCKPVWFKRAIEIAGQNYIKQIVAPLGTPLMMDQATENRTRPSMAKVRVEIDLTKPKINSLWIGTEDESYPHKGFTQKLEYENPPKFCIHCRMLGHSIAQCRRVEKKKKEEKAGNGDAGKSTEVAEESGVKEDCDLVDSDNVENGQKENSKKKEQTGNKTTDGIEENAKEATGKQNGKEKVGDHVVGRDMVEIKRKTLARILAKNKKKRKAKKGLKKKTKVTVQVSKSQQTDNERKSTKQNQENSNEEYQNEVQQGHSINQEVVQDNEKVANSDQHGPALRTEPLEANHPSTASKKNDPRDKNDDMSTNNPGSNNGNVGKYGKRSSSLDTVMRNHKGIELVVDLNTNQDFLQRSREQEECSETEDEISDSLADFNNTGISQEAEEEHVDSDESDGTSVGNGGAYVTIVYAKCTSLERQELWDDLTDISNQVQSGWCIGGDFNVILEPSEKIGGKIHRAYKSFDFAACVNRCGLEDAGFVGSNYTWCNNRRPGKRIWKRLDRVIINDNWLQRFNNVTVRHLSTTGSDHRPLLLKCYDSNTNAIKHFRFRHFWVEQPGFMDLVGQDWQIKVKGNPMWILQQKLKRLGKRLSKWSREDIGDIFQKVEEWEATLQQLEDVDAIDKNEQSRTELNKGQAEYVHWMAMQEALLEQKSQIKWFEEGDSNTRYFHNVIKDRRRRLQLHRIKNSKGKWLHSDEKISNSAIRHFKRIFNLPEPAVDDNIFSCVPKIITDDDNVMLSKIPIEE